MTAALNQPINSNKKLLILLHVGFFLIGIITVFLGQILPILSARLSLNDRQAGWFFVAQFSGSLLGTLFYNRIIKKLGYLPMLLGGFCLLSIGCGLINFNSLWWCALSVFLYGIGIGLTIPAINLLVIELNFQRVSAASNIINFFWGSGAILCKPFVDFVGEPDSFLAPAIILAASFLVVGLAMSFSHYQQISLTYEESTEIALPIWKTKIAWLIALFNFLHIGIESSVGGWITTYELRLSQTSSQNWLSAAFIFFLFLVVGRGIAPLLFRYASENAVLLFSLLIMLGGTLIILQAENFSYLLLGVSILGIGTSSIFPTNIARFTKTFGPKSTRQATPLFLFGTLGGAFTTWLIGYISTTFNSLRSGFLVILISCFLLVILQVILANVTLKKAA